MTEDQKKTAKKLAQDHWGYVESLIRAHGESEETITLVKFHYISALEHGFKHGVEDERDRIE